MDAPHAATSIHHATASSRSFVVELPRRSLVRLLAIVLAGLYFAWLTRCMPRSNNNNNSGSSNSCCKLCYINVLSQIIMRTRQRTAAMKSNQQLAAACDIMHVRNIFAFALIATTTHCCTHCLRFAQRLPHAWCMKKRISSNWVRTQNPLVCNDVPTRSLSPHFARYLFAAKQVWLFAAYGGCSHWFLYTTICDFYDLPLWSAKCEMRMQVDDGTFENYLRVLSALTCSFLQALSQRSAHASRAAPLPTSLRRFRCLSA